LSWFKLQHDKKCHIPENTSVTMKDETQKDEVNPQGETVIM